MRFCVRYPARFAGEDGAPQDTDGERAVRAA
jgi:hypothetical protein